MLALLSHNDASTVQSIMDANKMAILGMFKLISKDPLKLSSEVLHVCEAIAANPDVSKTTKVQILSAQTLDQISHMYHSTDSYTLDRDGHPTTNEITENEPTANQSVENNAAPNRDAGSDGEGGVVSMATDDGGRTPVVGEAHVKVTNGREVAHKFMMTVCASSTEGLIFTPKGPSDTKVHNPTLLKFITGQNKVNEDPLLQTLVLTILRNAPDILHGYLCAPTITLEAKVSMRLLSTLTLVTRVLQLPLPSGFVAALSTSTRTPTHAHVHVQGHAQPHTHAHARTVRSEVFADYMIPACMKATVVAQGLQSTSPLVKMSFTAALIRSLDKASTLLHSLPPHAHGTVRLCRDALLKRLPPFQVVVVGALQSSQTQYLQSLSAADEDERKGAKLVYLRSLQLVRRYIRCFPDSIKVNRYDMGKTIPTEMFGTTFDTHVTGTILSMLLEAPDVKWAYQRRSGSYASLLGQLIELLITSTHATVYALTRQLVTKVTCRVGRCVVDKMVDGCALTASK
ncbi:hypothetical protein SARC_01851 [Sphaeroforma arctica JP610]|uniref:URB1 N-terminal domain-containing protein n=1 Tax=Sphaeroforma arctica JP610 TaxID=667725 RepID=A0A0L0GAF7_9EUKA|nr:hypothetical protein SARC_01851 [Sphaeroforma arctica JP610]KNC85975.1 hypothetical protein SARC_01851 [Sphaeroforma arctica JP610]|eukprot:XP_014159877.1 hypothetical protein SARC_01851 [Sphaeroforma arctica JP610]